MGANKKLYGWYDTGGYWLPIKVSLGGSIIIDEVPSHYASHEAGGVDEINVTGLVGLEGFISYIDTRSKLIIATRDMTAPSGNVAYTGVGFTPTSIQVVAGISTKYSYCVGFVDSSKAGGVLASWQAGLVDLLDRFIIIYTSSTKYQIADVNSFDADGFTLAWTKGGLPTGTALLKFLCFR